MRRRGIRAGLAVLLVLVLLVSALFIALEAGHDCCGEGCSVCAQISACTRLLQQLALALPALAAAGIACAALSLPAGALRAQRAPATLITLRVKLSD